MTDQPQASQNAAIDKERLRQKYLEERNKRLRADGNDQYLRVAGQLAHYLDDPYTPVTPRDPKTDHVTFAFIGGGFAGLATAARLSEAGIKDVRIIEKGGDFGGTWYWNRYPGAQCDTASMVYMPLLEETGHMPSEKYAHAPEILAHCQRIGKQYGLYDNALFHTEVVSLDWDEAKSRWIIRTNRGDAFTAQFVGMGTGPLHVPKLPGIEGIESFKGHSFHTSRWDYDYTGGDPVGRADGETGRQARRHHRHRRHVRAVRAASRARLQGTLRLPAHAVLRRCPRQRADRSRMVCGDRDIRLAAALAGEFYGQPGRRLRGRRSGAGRLDRSVAAHSRQDHGPAARAAHPAEHAGGVRGFRFREDGGNPRPGRCDRQRPRDGREAEGLVSPALQAAVLP